VVDGKPSSTVVRDDHADLGNCSGRTRHFYSGRSFVVGSGVSDDAWLFKAHLSKLDGNARVTEGACWRRRAGAIPVLACVESAIYPRLATPPEATKRLVGLAIFILTVRLLLTPFPLSNILPAGLIAFISLAYLEQDGLLLIVGLVGGCLLLILEWGLFWQLAHDAKWITGLV
jgi:hypothetical protein